MNELDKSNNLPVTRASLDRLHQSMKEMPQIECPLKHHHVTGKKDGPTHGVYAREVFLPAGICVIGEIHKYEQLNIMSQGDVTIAIEGQEPFRVQAPYTIVSPAGVQRAVIVHADTVWTTIHGTDEQDVEELEKTLVVDTFDKYLQFKEEQQYLEGK